MAGRVAAMARRAGLEEEKVVLGGGVALNMGFVVGKAYSYLSTRTGSNSPRSAHKALDGALEGSDLSLEDVHYVVGTGYGRVNVPLANRAITEISCHARGANFMAGPSIRTILDMGGQDCKVMRCDENGKVQNFIMNDK